MEEYGAFWENSGGHSQVGDSVKSDVNMYYKEAQAELVKMVQEKHKEEEAAASTSSSSGEKRKRDSE